MTTYAGASVGLVDKVLPAEEIVKDIQKEALKVLENTARRFQQE